MPETRVERYKGGATLYLKGDLLFESAEETTRVLRSCVRYRTLTVRIEELGKIDLGGIQPLYALARTRRERAMPLVIEAGDAGERIERMTSFAGLPPLVRAEPSDG